MSDLLLDLGTYFDSAGLTVAGAFFTDTMLDQPDSAVAVYEYMGSTPVVQVAGVERSLQVVARDKDPGMAKAKANELYQSLVTEDGIVNLTEERWCMLLPKQPPFKMKVDVQGRAYYCFNVSIITYSD